MIRELGQLAGLMGKLPKIREEMEKLQGRLGELTAEGQAGGGMVTVRVNGKFNMVNCTIVEEAVQDRELLEDLVDTAPNPEHHAQRRDASRILAQLLAKLSPARRAAFVLFEIEGYTGEEIAKLEGIPVKTVYTRLHYARKDFFRLVSQASAADAALAEHPRPAQAERLRAEPKRGVE